MVSNSGVQSVLGQAAAAKQNRQSRARGGILQALGRLGIPHREWPNFVQAYYRVPNPRYEQRISVKPFQPPPIDRLNESAEEWRKKANAAWDQHANTIVQSCEFWVKQGLDEKIFPAKHSRGPGKAQPGRKRKNTALQRRYEWAALRRCGDAWKEIAAKYQTKESTVIKAASEVLRIADWPTKPKANKSSPPLPRIGIPEVEPRVKGQP